MSGEFERVLTRLLHDVRTPLGVAHGYLRLVREGRLPSDDDRDRALDKTRDALSRMSDLCDEATAAIDGAQAIHDDRVPVAGFVNAVRTQLNLLGVSLEIGTLETGATLRTPVHIDRLAQAVAVVISAARHASAAAVRVRMYGEALHFGLRGGDAAEELIVALPLETEQE